MWAIFSIALLLRLAFFFHHQAQGWQLQHDPSLYLALADGIGKGVFSMFHPLEIPETTRMPGYPFLIHVIGSIPALLILQAMISSLKVPIAFSIGKLWGLKGRALLLSPVLIAIAPLDIILAGNLLTEPVFTTLIFAALFYIMRMKNVQDLVLVALCFAAAAYIRPNGLLIASIVVAFLFFRAAGSRSRAIALAVLIILLILPWLLRDHRLDGRFQLSDSATVVAAHFHVPEVLVLAGDPDAAGYRSHLRDLASATNWSDRGEMRSYFETLDQEVKNVFFDHPIEWTIVQLKKAVLIAIAPGSGHIQKHFGSGWIGNAILAVSAIFSFLVIAIMVGVVIHFRRMKWPQWSFFIMIITIIFTSAISTADSRFRDPAMPLLLLLGGWLLQQWRSRSITDRENAPVSPSS